MPENCPHPEPHQSSPYAPSHFPEVHKFPGYCCTWTWSIQAPYIQCTKSHVPLHCFGRTKRSIEPRGTCICFVTRPVFTVRSCYHLAHIPSWGPPLVEYALQLTHIFGTTFHIWGRFSIRNLSTRHAVLTETDLSRTLLLSTEPTLHTKRPNTI